MFEMEPVFTRAFYCLFFAPLCNLGMVSGKQDLRDFPIAEFCRARVLRSFE